MNIALIFAVCFLALTPWKLYAGTALTVGQDVLIQFNNQVSKARKSQMRSKVNVTRIRQFKALGNIQHWQLASPMDANKVIQQLQNDPAVAHVEINHPRPLHLLPNDTDIGLQWALQNTGQFVGAISGVDMKLPSAWNINTGSKQVIVAVIDDSVDIRHPDLQANIWTNTAEIANNGIDDDGNGFIDDVHGWDFVNGDNDPSADAGLGEGHGTMVAGCIGAVGNNVLGVSGVNWNVSIMPIKFTPDVAGELEAMNYAINNGAQIINASWGGPQFSYMESLAMKVLLKRGILLVAAAGNYHGNNDRVADYPSGLPYANILAVSSSSFTGDFSTWAHYGVTSVDITAPGEGIYTTTTPNQYDYTDGTSFSAPLTAGVAALVKAQYPTATYQSIKGRIMASVSMMNQRGLSATDGRIHASKALSMQPKPVLVLSNIQLSDGNNNLIDPNETLNLNITLENVWQATTGITASLSSADPLLTISTATSTWNNLNMGQKAAANRNFVLQTGNFSGFHRFPLTLTINTASGHVFNRYFSLVSGNLQSDITYTTSTMQNDQDLFQYFHIDVPAGAPVLNISSSGLTDVDILLKFGSQPLFDYNSYDLNAVYGRDSQSFISSNDQTGNEQILIPNPQAGTWHAVIISFDRQSGSYHLRASTTSSIALVPTATPTSSAKQGPCLQSLALSATSTILYICLLLAFMLLDLRRRSCRNKLPA